VIAFATLMTGLAELKVLPTVIEDFPPTFSNGHEVHVWRL